MYKNSAIALKPSARISATNTGSAIDIQDFHGQAKIILNSSATEGADHTSDVKLTHCDTSGGTYVDAGVTFAQVTNAAASFQVADINIDKLKRYVKVVNTLAGTSPFVTAGVTLIGKKQST